MTVKALNAQELKKMMDENQDFVLIDCREQGEWDTGHIDGAKLVPMSQFEDRYNEIEKHKNELIVMQCRSGKRSLDLCMRLLEKGHKHVANLEGGIMDWCESGYDISED